MRIYSEPWFFRAEGAEKPKKVDSTRVGALISNIINVLREDRKSQAGD